MQVLTIFNTIHPVAHRLVCVSGEPQVNLHLPESGLNLYMAWNRKVFFLFPASIFFLCFDLHKLLCACLYVYCLEDHKNNTTIKLQIRCPGNKGIKLKIILRGKTTGHRDISPQRKQTCDCFEWEENKETSCGVQSSSCRCFHMHRVLHARYTFWLRYLLHAKGCLPLRQELTGSGQKRHRRKYENIKL